MRCVTRSIPASAAIDRARMAEESAPWYASWFDEDYQTVYAHRDMASAEGEAAFAVRALALRPSERILDLCAGDGRHLVHLLRWGYRRAFGSDLSSAQLRAARQRCLAYVCSPPLVRADMRSVIAAELDAVLSFFTSFGYFESDDENTAVLHAVAAMLRVGGRFFVDLPNRDFLLAHLAPRSERTVGGWTVLEERRYISATRRVEKTITVCKPEGRLARRESVRLYSRQEFAALLDAAGMTCREVFGDFSGLPYGADSERMIIIAVRAD